LPFFCRAKRASFFLTLSPIENPAGSAQSWRQMKVPAGRAEKIELDAPCAIPREDLLTQDEMAARLKTTVRTVVRLQHEGILPFIAMGKAVRFYWPAVISHLISNFMVTKCAPHRPLLLNHETHKKHENN
jgi:excisionase family DNA binding protein